ncbi:MAG: EthD family reductase [Anaerolineae bacterium]|nr:EthD family reductase [Anaerolineae bacterium]
MVKLVLLFKHPASPGDFEARYAQNRALMGKMPGVMGIQESTVIGGPQGAVPYTRIIEIGFADFDALDAALTSPEGTAAGQDLMDFAGQGVELLFAETAGNNPPQPLSPADLQAYLDAHNIPAEIVYPGAPTPTVPAAAEALGVEVDQIVKSVVFLVNSDPYLVYGCGTRRVDSRKLADRLDVGRKRVRLANEEQVLDITGYAIGTVPPIGLKTSMPVFMDPTVQAYDTVYAGGGGIDALLKIRSADLQAISGAEVIPMLETVDT